MVGRTRSHRFNQPPAALRLDSFCFAQVGKLRHREGAGEKDRAEKAERIPQRSQRLVSGCELWDRPA